MKPYNAQGSKFTRDAIIKKTCAANDSGNFHETATTADRSSVIAGGGDSPLSVQNASTIRKRKRRKKQSNDREDLNNT